MLHKSIGLRITSKTDYNFIASLVLSVLICIVYDFGFISWELFSTLKVLYKEVLFIFLLLVWCRSH